MTSSRLLERREEEHRHGRDRRQDRELSQQEGGESARHQAATLQSSASMSVWDAVHGTKPPSAVFRPTHGKSRRPSSPVWLGTSLSHMPLPFQPARSTRSPLRSAESACPKLSPRSWFI